MANKPFKKEFTTYWRPHQMWTELDRLPIRDQGFFDRVVPPDAGRCIAMLPDNIPFESLISLTGRKTRVTIEVIE